jgi:hypothetical protein
MKRVLFVLLVLACNKRVERHATPDDRTARWMTNAQARSQKLDRAIDLAPTPLVAHVDASWSCAANASKTIECRKDEWTLWWALETESSVKPDDTLIAAEQRGSYTGHGEGRTHFTIGTAEIHGYHGLFNQEGRGEASIVFVGWHGEPPNRTKLTITATGNGDSADPMAVMMTTTPK